MRYPFSKLLLFGLLFSLFSAGAVFASSICELTCKNEACRYKARATFGGGILFDQVTGYCVRDNKFVHLMWRRSEKAPDPLKLFNAQTGEIMEMYRCPDCGDPFLPIKEAQDFKYCPKCHRPSIEYHLISYLD